MNRFRTMAAAAILVVLVSACASTPAPVKDLAYNVVVQQATARFIEYKQSMGDRSLRAAEVARVASILRDLAAGEETTISDLQARALSIIAERSNLQPSDKVLANTLVAAVGELLQQKIKDGLLKPDDRVRVENMLTQIVATCQFYIIGGATPVRGIWWPQSAPTVEATVMGSYPWRRA